MDNCKAQIDNSLDLLYGLENQSEKKTNIFENSKNINLQIALFKTPSVPSRIKKYLRLTHSLHGEEPEICLFVPNRRTNLEYKITTDECIDFTIDYYTELLKKHKINNIKTVMPVKQLKAEYGTYFVRRKLTKQFDLFLCKTSLLYNPRFVTALGKIFKIANKEPLGISIPKMKQDYDPEFAKNIERAIFTTILNIRPFSDNYSVPFGRLSHKREQLKENLTTVLDQIMAENVIPGGFENIKALYLWPTGSKTIPLYFSTDIPLNLPRPLIKKKWKVTSVEDEISSVPGKRVKVMSDGRVILIKDPDENHLEEEQNGVDEEDEDQLEECDTDEEEEEEEMNESEDDYKVRPNKRSVKQNRIENNEDDEDDEEDDDDDAIEAMEQQLMIKKRQAEAEEEEEEESSFGKKKRIDENAKKAKKSSKRNSFPDDEPTLTSPMKNIRKEKKGRVKQNKSARKLKIKQEKAKLSSKLKNSKTKQKKKV